MTGWREFARALKCILPHCVLLRPSASFVGRALVFLMAVIAGCTLVTRPEQPPSSGGGAACVPVGRWVVPGSRSQLTTPEVVARAADARIVLLGEDHDRPEHHWWELQMLAALNGRRADMVIGFEMFPRSVQGVLDRWVAGELDEEQFLLQTRWDDVWGIPARVYMPLFQFARMNRLPMVALNVARSLIGKVGQEGWEAIPLAEREGLSDPAPPAAQYAEKLAEVYRMHVDEGGMDGGNEEGLKHFIQAQLVWDRAFAEGLSSAAKAHPDALVVGIMGRGHVENGYGVPHQLAALGVRDVQVFVPWDSARDCNDLVAGLADAVFGVERTAPPATRVMMGVLLEDAENGVRVTTVFPDSAAASAGIREGDVVVEAAGRSVTAPAELRRIVGERQPGDCLALLVRRNGETREIVVLFPSAS
jgi:uncharacterized iron-regulated protein